VHSRACRACLCKNHSVPDEIFFFFDITQKIFNSREPCVYFIFGYTFNILHCWQNILLVLSIWNIVGYLLKENLWKKVKMWASYLHCPMSICLSKPSSPPVSTPGSEVGDTVKDLLNNVIVQLDDPVWRSLRQSLEWQKSLPCHLKRLYKMMRTKVLCVAAGGCAVTEYCMAEFSLPGSFRW